MEQILLAYDLSKETAIMTPYKSIKAMVYSLSEDTNFFKIVARVLQRNTFVPDLFILCRYYELQMTIDLIKENGFTLKKKGRSKHYPTETMTSTDYTDDLALLSNTPTQAESPSYSLEKAAAGIGLYVNANKTGFMCFKWEGAISTLRGKTLKLVDHIPWQHYLIYWKWCQHMPNDGMNAFDKLLII